MTKSLNIMICGAGLRGLGAAIALARKGHHVIVLEAASKLNEVGAGIQIPPNSTRVLRAYGLEEKIREKIVWPGNINLRRYATGDLIVATPLHPIMSERYGHPYWLIHRADYQRILYDAAKAAGATVLLGSPIESVEEGEGGPFVVLKDARQFKADLVVGADGIRSKTRKFVLKENIEAINSRNCAYRATVSAQIMNADPAIAHLMTDINSNCWIGHERHIMAYPIRNGELYNIVMSHPGQASVGRWNEPGNLEEMKKHYCNFDPIIQKVLEHVDHCSKWKLAYLPPLTKWVSDSGRVVLIGDAAHGMLPYLAQGAAMSIEDGAALAECLDRVQHMSDIPNVLQEFQAIRKPRCEAIALVAQANGDLWHMADGPEQAQRDCGMRQEMDNSSRQGVVNPNKWSDEDFQSWLFGYDTVKLTNDFLDRHLSQSFGTEKEQEFVDIKNHSAISRSPPIMITR